MARRFGTLAPARIKRSDPDGHTIGLTWAAPLTLNPGETLDVAGNDRSPGCQRLEEDQPFVGLHPHQLAFNRGGDDDRIGAFDGTAHGLWTAEVRSDRRKLADAAERLQVPGLARIPLRYANASARLKQGLDHIAADKSAAAEDGHVLAEDRDRPAVDGAVAGDDAVAERALGVHAEVGGAVAGELVELGERARVHQRLDALAGGHLAGRVLLLHRALGPGVLRLLDAPLEVGQLPGGGVDVDVVGDVLPTAVDLGRCHAP